MRWYSALGRVAETHTHKHSHAAEFLESRLSRWAEGRFLLGIESFRGAADNTDWTSRIGVPGQSSSRVIQWLGQSEGAEGGWWRESGTGDSHKVHKLSQGHSCEWQVMDYMGMPLPLLLVRLIESHRNKERRTSSDQSWCPGIARMMIGWWYGNGLYSVSARKSSARPPPPHSRPLQSGKFNYT